MTRAWLRIEMPMKSPRSDIQPFLRTTFRLGLVLAMAIPATCSLDLTGPDPDLPDLTGDWLISVSGVGPTGPGDTLNGSCELDAFHITIRRQNKGEIDRSKFGGGFSPISGNVKSYSWSHDGFRVICSGFVGPADSIFGVADTILLVPAGEEDGIADYLGCGLGLGGCSGPKVWSLHFWEEGFSLRAHVEASSTRLDLFDGWYEFYGDPPYLEEPAAVIGTTRRKALVSGVFLAQHN